MRWYDEHHMCEVPMGAEPNIVLTITCYDKATGQKADLTPAAFAKFDVDYCYGPEAWERSIHHTSKHNDNPVLSHNPRCWLYSIKKIGAGTYQCKAAAGKLGDTELKFAVVYNKKIPKGAETPIVHVSTSHPE